jgi:hypothetical protein
MRTTFSEIFSCNFNTQYLDVRDYLLERERERERFKPDLYTNDLRAHVRER